MKRTYLFLFCMICAVLPLFSQDIDVSIRFWDKQVYHANSPDQDVEVLVTITNNSPNGWHFKLADERCFSIDFAVRSMDNRALEASEQLKNIRASHRPLYVRDVRLESMESFSFRENLRDYVPLETSGNYMVSLTFYPELMTFDPSSMPMGGVRESVSPRLESNMISLPLQRKPNASSGMEAHTVFLDESGAVLERIQMPPDQVISYLLDARIKEQWEKFFLYIDLESMIQRDGRRRRAWLSESEEGRQNMLAQYRLDLMNSHVDGDIGTIPIEYRILNTRYSPNEGEVKVHERFRDGRYISNKEYSYTLKKRDNIWLVTGYSVVNLGVE
jgi:hypothetical protein